MFTKISIVYQNIPLKPKNINKAIIFSTLMLMDNEEWNIWSTSGFVDSNFGHKYDNNPILFIVKNFVDKDLITFKKLLL